MKNTHAIQTSTSLCPPWAEHSNKIRALFADDPDVRVEYDAGGAAPGEGPSVTLRVAKARKAEALSRVLPAGVVFGNVTLTVRVVPANPAASAADDLRAAFEGNPALSRVLELESPLGQPVAFAVFARRIVDVPCDSMADPRGNRSVTVEQLARDVVGDRAGAFPCTEAEDEEGA